MRPASSKPYSGLPLNALQHELTNQIKKLTLLEGDRAQFKRQAQENQAKNAEWIEKLRQQNRRLKETRDQLISRQRSYTTIDNKSSTNTSFSKPELRSESYWRRELDKQKHLTKTLKNRLMNMQDKLKEVENNKISYIEESPLMRNIRILENRLDKIMIKYNEANSIRDTYEQIVKRLKQERMGYDNQVTAIERSLKGKESDFEELLLLAHDALHAKQLAQAQLKKYEHKRSAIKDLREQYLADKKNEIEDLRLTIGQGQPNQPSNQTVKLYNVDRNGEADDQANELQQFEEAFKKLKEVTGVSDANEIIYKFKTQGMTSTSLEELRDRYRVKIEDLRMEKEKAKQSLNRVKYEGVGRGSEKKKLDEVENTFNKIQRETERVKVKWEKLNKILVNVKVAVEHLSKHLSTVKMNQDSILNSSTVQMDFDALLHQTKEKLKIVYQAVKKDSHFNSDKFKQSTAGIEKFIHKGGDSDNAEAKTRPSNFLNQHDQSSGNQFDEEMLDSTTDKIKQRFQISKPSDKITRNFLKYKA